MSGRRLSGRLVRAGVSVVQARVALYAGWVAAVGAGALALLACAIAALTGNGPGLGALLLIVLGVALVAFLVVWWLVGRLDVPLLAAAIARRILARRAGRRP